MENFYNKGVSKQVDWNKEIYENFCELALLSADEKKILLTRIKDNWTISQQAMAFGMAESTIKRKISILKKKYDKVQERHPDKLPKRRKSSVEEYMDNH